MSDVRAGSFGDAPLKGTTGDCPHWQLPRRAGVASPWWIRPCQRRGAASRSADAQVSGQPGSQPQHRKAHQSQQLRGQGAWVVPCAAGPRLGAPGGACPPDVGTDIHLMNIKLSFQFQQTWDGGSLSQADTGHACRQRVGRLSLPAKSKKDPTQISSETTLSTHPPPGPPSQHPLGLLGSPTHGSTSKPLLIRSVHRESSSACDLERV
jgi:hypothetical protein